MTSVNADKNAAYSEADYRVGAHETFFVLRIGQPSTELPRMFEETGQNSALFITAFNPEGTIQDDAENLAAHESLGVYLRGITQFVIEGEGKGTGINAQWACEKSYLALGIDKNTAIMLGVMSRQDAVVWVAEDAIPQILLTR